MIDDRGEWDAAGRVPNLALQEPLCDNNHRPHLSQQMRQQAFALNNAEYDLYTAALHDLASPSPTPTHPNELHPAHPHDAHDGHTIGPWRGDVLSAGHSSRR